MSNKPHKPTVDEPPNWWQHPAQTWIDLRAFFSDIKLTNPANWQQLTRGLSNFNYKLSLTSDDRRQFYFVQVINSNNLALLPQGNNNRATQSVLDYLTNRSSIKPWLIDCYFSTSSIRVFEWIDFEPLTIDRFNPEIISSTNQAQAFFTYDTFCSSVSDFMASLHNMGASNEQQQLVTIDIQQHLRDYHQLAMERAPDHSEQIKQLLRQALLIAEPFIPSKLCHNDLNLNNLLWINAQTPLKVIDWEYACYSDPLMDLAGFLLNFQFNHQQQQNFIEQYSNKTGTVIHPDSLKNMKQLCQIISKLWQFCSN